MFYWLQSSHYFVFSLYQTPTIYCIFVDWYRIFKIRHSGYTLNSQWSVIFCQALEEDYLYIQSMLVHTGKDLGPLQYLRWRISWQKNQLTPFQKTVKKNAKKKMNIVVDKYPQTNAVKILCKSIFSFKLIYFFMLCKPCIIDFLDLTLS